jgi:hypothetical protein
MKPAAARFEVPLVAAGLMVVMLVAMWAQRNGENCTLSLEAPRQLLLSRETDREHLATDVASANRIARRYMRSTMSPAEQHAQFVQCEETLVQEIATRHGLSPDAVRAIPSDAQ